MEEAQSGMGTAEPTQVEKDIAQIKNELGLIREKLRAITFLFQQLVGGRLPPGSTG